MSATVRGYKLPDFRLPNTAYEELSGQLGILDEQDRAWLALGLTHGSYANYQKKQEAWRPFGLIADLLEDIGGRLVHAVLAHTGLSKHEQADVRQLASFVALTNEHMAQAVAEELNLLSKALLSDPLMAEIAKFDIVKDRILQMLGRRLLGVVWVCHDYSMVARLVEHAVQQAGIVDRLQQNISPVEKVDFKSALQEAVQKRMKTIPRYTLLEESGPAHRKSFRVQVSTPGGRVAEGAGSSKNRAEHDAARRYLQKYDSLIGRTNDSVGAPLGVSKPDRRSLRLEIRRDILVLSEQLRIPADKAVLLEQALTHASYRHEMPHSGRSDYGTLAFVGSKALDVMGHDLLFKQVLETGADTVEPSLLKRTTGIIYAAETVAEAFDLLSLGRLLLVGRAMAGSTPSVSVKSDVLQAVLGAMFMVRARLDHPEDFLPRNLLHWLDGAVRTVVSATAPDYPKSRLQEILQLLQIEFQYASQQAGPDHAPQLCATLTMRSPVAGSATFRGPWAKSKKAAEAAAALSVLSVLNDVNSNPEFARGHTLGTSTNSLARFFIHHELAVVPLHRSTIQRWRLAGLLGADILAVSGEIGLAKWAHSIQAVLAADAGESVQTDQLVRYLHAVRSQGPSGLHRVTREVVSQVRGLIDRLNPLTTSEHVMQSETFDNLLALGQLLRLQAEPVVDVALKELLESLTPALKRLRLRPPETRALPREVILEKRGFHLAILTDVLAKVSTIAEGALTLGVEDGEDSDHLVFVVSAPQPVEQILPKIQTSLLWSQLIRMGLVNEPAVDKSILKICTWVGGKEINTGLSRQIIEAVGQGVTPSQEHAIARIVHDLKNELIAYQVARDVTGLDRTTSLQRLAEASRHLDRASMICRMLESVSMTLADPMMEDVDVGGLFRGYVVDKLRELAANIRLLPPRANSDATIRTSRDFLRSILDNLVQNAAEAMPVGGDISVEWIYDEQQRLLTFEVEDTGPGVPADVLASFQAVAPSRSGKAYGMGLGLLSIRVMVERLNGRVSVGPRPEVGTRWTVEIPDATEFHSDIGAADSAADKGLDV